RVAIQVDFSQGARIIYIRIPKSGARNKFKIRVGGISRPARSSGLEPRAFPIRICLRLRRVMIIPGSRCPDSDTLRDKQPVQFLARANCSGRIFSALHLLRPPRLLHSVAMKMMPEAERGDSLTDDRTPESAASGVLTT